MVQRVELTQHQKAKYKETLASRMSLLTQPLRTELRDEVVGLREFYGNLQEIINCPALPAADTDPREFCAKLGIVSEVLEHLWSRYIELVKDSASPPGSGSVGILCNTNSSLRYLDNYLRLVHPEFPVRVLDDYVDGNAHEKIIHSFPRDTPCPFLYLISSNALLSHYEPDISGINHIILYETEWVPGRDLHILGRQRSRLGKKIGEGEVELEVYRIVSRDTVEEAVTFQNYQSLLKKEDSEEEMEEEKEAKLTIHYPSVYTDPAVCLTSFVPLPFSSIVRSLTFLVGGRKRKKREQVGFSP